MPVIEIPFTVKAVLATFLTVINLAVLVVPTFCRENVRDVADKETAVPVPFNVTTCGLVGSESLMVSVAARPKAAVGVNVTLIVQLDAAARLVPHVVV